MALETLRDAMQRLSQGGYDGTFRAEEGGLRHVESNELCDPKCVNVDEVVRFEGTTDPDEEAILFALHSPERSLRGTYAVAYGPSVDPLDAECLEALEASRRRNER